MPKVTLIHNERTVELTLKAGQTVYDAAMSEDLDELGFGECGAGCSCSTCHVYVESGANDFAEPTIDEEDLLDNLPTYQSNSRLACQLVLQEGSDVTVRIADA